MTADGEIPARDRDTRRRTAPSSPAKARGQPRLGRMHERLQDVNILLSVTRRISGTDSLDEILEALVEMTSMAINCDRSSFFLNDPGTGELYSRVAQGVHHREIRILNNDGIAGATFQTGEASSSTTLTPTRASTDDRRETGYVTKTVLCVPMRTAKGDVIGVAQALNKRERPLHQARPSAPRRHRGSVGTGAAELPDGRADAEGARPGDGVPRHRLRHHLRSSISLAAAAGDGRGDADAQGRALDAVPQRREDQRAVLRVAMGPKIGEIRFPNHAGIAGAVFTTGKTINIPYAYADLRFNPAFDKKTGFFTRSILCMPIINKHGKIIGVTQVLNKRGGPFTAEDESRLKAFTAQISIALENAKLFDDVQKMKNYNESMLESMSNGVITLDERDIIVTCNSRRRCAS